MEKRCVLRGNVDGYSSYSLHLFKVAEGLNALGRDIAVFPILMDLGKAPIPRLIQESLVRKHQPELWEMVIHCPSYTPPGEKRIVYNTMWETTRLSKQGIMNLNQADLIVVPSEFNQTLFNAQGVKRPMVKVPMGIDDSVFHYKPQKRKDVFVFGTAGRTMAGGCRKRIGMVVEAFVKAFPKRVKDVRLEVKCFPDDPELEIDDDRIAFQRVFWSKPQLADWYEHLDGFVSASSGEGWGLHQHEMMATGRPVIAVPFGGIAEFYDETVGYPVEYDLEASGKHYDNGGLWAMPRMSSLVDRMREVFNERRSEKSIRASERGMKLNWDNSNAILDKQLTRAGFYR